MKVFIYLFLAFNILGITHAKADQADRELLSYGADKRVDIVSYGWEFYPPDLRNPLRYRELKESFNVEFSSNVYEYARNFQYDDPNLHKIVFIDICVDSKTKNIPKNKLICFIWEPHSVYPSSSICEYYDRIYTFNDDLIDNKKFFKYYYPVLSPMISDIPPFQEKKLCVMMVSRWIPERVKIVDFFATQPKDLLHVYGRKIHELLPQYRDHEMIKGEVPGYPSSLEKFNTFKNYRFCVCFENTHTIPGYITEKIFDVFAGGCVPIYWGPNNIEQHIPKDCFIDYRNFKNDEDMLEFITSMQEVEYNQYLTNIRLFLESEKAKFFSIDAFEQVLYDAVNK